MAPLEQLMALEIEFHRRLRLVTPSADEGAALHTSFALQSGYEQLLRAVGRVTIIDVERLAARSLMTGDVRDVHHARDSLAGLLGLRHHDE
jgi:hypothetical protein